MAILIAEDNTVQRHYLNELLSREFPENTPIIEADNGETALELALKHKPTLCILDIQMPNMRNSTHAYPANS